VSRLPLVGYLVLVLVIAFSLYSQEGQIKRNEQARVALCALRQDLDLRIASSSDFLVTHPQGIPGIPASLIRQSLTNSVRTRKSLNVLDC